MSVGPLSPIRLVTRPDIVTKPDTRPEWIRRRDAGRLPAKDLTRAA